MDNEKDMIEINLNTAMQEVYKKEFSYFGNIQFDRVQDGGFPYGQYRNELEESSSVPKIGKKICGLKLPTKEESLQKISCLRQMYCPDCQQRLDEDSIILGRHGLCCVPLLAISRLFKHLKMSGSRSRIYCKNCGGDMGYFKYA